MSPKMRPMFRSFGFEVQWIDLFHAGRCNWINFDFIKLVCEWDKIGAHFEVEAALFGFALSFQVPIPETEQSRKLKERMKEVEANQNLMPLREFEARVQAEHGADIQVVVPDDLKPPEK